MNILITGAFGFVGTNLSKALKTQSNHYLIAVDTIRPDNHSYDEFFDWESLHLLNWNHIEVVIHLAGKAHDTRNTIDNHVYFHVNVGLTQQIFDYFLKSPAKKFIFFSSVKAIADEVRGEMLTEDETPNPKTAYGMSKLVAEQFLQDFKLPADKLVYILRPCMIHGPGNKGNLNLLYNVVQKGTPWPLGEFDNKRSFTAITNLIFVINELVEKPVEQGIYQVADDEAISTNRLIVLIAESIGLKPRIWRINKKLIRVAAKLGDAIRLPLNSERLQKLTESYVVSNKKLKQALGIQKMPVQTEEGIKNTLTSFQ